MFDSELSIRAVAPTRWQLTAPLVWTGQQGDTFLVPPGFVTDFATSPRFLHWLVLPYGAYTRAAVLHDWLIETMINHPDPTLRVPSRDVDGIFRVAMRDLGVPWSKRWVMWAAVRAASCFNPKRAYRRQFWKDAPKVLGMALLVASVPQGLIGAILGLDAKWIAGVMLLAGPVLPGAIGVLISLGWIRLITALSGGAPAIRKSRRGRLAGNPGEGKRDV